MGIALTVNALPLCAPLTGVGRYLVEVASHLAEDPRFETTWFYGYPSRRLLTEGEPRFRLPGAPQAVNMALAAPRVSRPLALALRAAHTSWPARRFDVYFEPNFVPRRELRARRTVVTVHDFSWLRNPEWHPRGRVAYITRRFKARIPRADRIITVSEAMRREALEALDFLPDAADRLIAIPNGYDSARFHPLPQETTTAYRVARNLPERCVLCVGTIEPRKNVARLTRAWATLPEPLKAAHPLVLAGPAGWFAEYVTETLGRDARHVRFLGYVPTAELPLLYNLATVFAYVSFYEGFGLPPLEAMACGVPVLASAIAAHREVCGEAALYVDPHDEEAIAHALRQLLEDDALRDDAVASGLERARRFSWTKSAAAHADCLAALAD